MNLLTIGVILFLAAVMVRSLMRGFVKTLFSMFFLIFVVVLAWAITPKMTDTVSKSENISAFVEEQSQNLLENALAPTENAPDSAEELGLAIVGSALQINGIREIASDKISDLMFSVIAFLISLALSAVIVIAIEIILAVVSKKRGISGINHFFGMLLGLVRGLLIVWVFMAIVTTLQFTAQGAALYRQIEESPFLYTLNSHNFVLTYLPRFILTVIG